MQHEERMMQHEDILHVASWMLNLIIPYNKSLV